MRKNLDYLVWFAWLVFPIIAHGTALVVTQPPATSTVSSAPVSLFFDDFNGPTLNPMWTASLPGAYSASYPNGYTTPEQYVGAPNFSFQTLAGRSVIRLNNTLGQMQRCGWGSASNFVASNFRYEARFNTLIQSSTTSIDGFVEIWIINATNSSLYDIVSPFGGGYDSKPYKFFLGSTIDGTFTQTPFTYANNTWYHLVLECAPGGNIHAAILADDGTELVGGTLAHGAEAYGSGFQIALSQEIGGAGAPYPVDVAVDYVSLTSQAAPVIITQQPANQTVADGGTASFSVSASGAAPLQYQWNFNGRKIAGATGPSLTLPNVQPHQAGDYTVLVRNALGSAISSNAVLTVTPTLASGLFDDFNGPNLNPIWQTNLPQYAYSGSFPGSTAEIATYLGAPDFAFRTLDSCSVLRLANSLAPLQRRGWGSRTAFGGTNFYYEVRFNTLDQSPATSIDGFLEIWIMDAANSNRYDVISPFGGSYDAGPYFFYGSSIDNAYLRSSFTYSNYTWYRLVLQSAPGQNLRGSILNDAGTELIGYTFSHGATAYPSGFKIGFSQVVGSAGATYPVDVAIDYVRLTTTFPPIMAVQPTHKAKAVLLPAPAQPALDATGTKTNLHLSWPIASGPFQVQQADSLLGPWTTVVFPLTTNGADVDVMVSPTNQQQFFRLVGP